MKKIKNILLMSVLSICSFAFANVVNADDQPFDLEGTTLYCTPEKIEAGSPSACYIIGKADVNSSNHSVHGYVVEAYATKDLKINNVSANEKIPNTMAVYKSIGSVNASHPFSNIELLKDFTCNFEVNNEATDSGCAVFYSTTNANAFKSTFFTGNNNPIELSTSYATYGVIGSINVEVSDTATGEKCGQLCVGVWQISNSKDYANYRYCTDGSSSKDGYTCGGYTESQTKKTNGNLYECKEIHLKAKTPIPVDPDQPNTGAFASYAILAAGALIAISAIAMAKKNTRFNKI